MMITLTERLDRTIVINARPEVVFGFFTADRQWASWWGAGSTIDPRPGGRMLIRAPNGAEVSGHVLDVQAPERFVFTYGSESGTPIPPDGSRVTITLAGHPSGTLLQLTHEFADTAVRDKHVQGWRYQLSLFANVVADRANAAAAETVDRWFAAWSEPDDGRRTDTLARIAAPAIRFHDRFSSVEGKADLEAHLAAVHQGCPIWIARIRFVPGVRLERRGDVRHCQWRLLADWAIVAEDDQERGYGTNLFVLDADGRIVEVTGFWT